jgi:hypothetical protein
MRERALKTQTGIVFAVDTTPELLDVYQPDGGGKRAAARRFGSSVWISGHARPVPI